jgi:hypothetical protein
MARDATGGAAATGHSRPVEVPTGQTTRGRRDTERPRDPGTEGRGSAWPGGLSNNADRHPNRAARGRPLMSDLIVHGGTPLRGRLVPSANKNAVLPDPVRHAADPAAGAPARHSRDHRREEDPRDLPHAGQPRRGRLRSPRARRAPPAHALRRTRAPPARGDAQQHHAGAGPAGALRRGAHRGRRQGLQPGHARDRPARGGDAELRRHGRAPARRHRDARRPPAEGGAALAGLRLGHHHRELRAVRRAGRRPQRADERRQRAARAGVLPVHDDAGRTHRRAGHLAPGGRRRGANSAAASSPSPRTSTRSSPSWRWAPSPAATSR